jgi:integrase
MAKALRWTDEKIKALKLPAGKAEHRTLVEPGLYLFLRKRVSGEVAKQWQYRAQVDGVRRWLSLGAYPAVGLAKAKGELALHQAVQQAAKKGEADHPALAARSVRKEKKAEPTITEAFDRWIADKRLGSSRKQGKPVRQRTVDVLTENFNADIRARIGEAKFATITPDALRSCIDAARRRGSPGAAAHVYRTLRGLVNFAIQRGYVQVDPMRTIENPKPYRPAPVVAANDAELVALLAAVDESQLWESTKLAIEFQLLTGVRPGEVRLATWQEFDMKRAVWSIAAERVKSDRAFRVHLSAPALEVLRRAKVVSGRSELVFPGANGGAMEKMAIARALSRLAKRAEDPNAKKLRPHDLRRTFRTMLSRLGIQPHVAELCMNHQETETMRRVYDGHDYTGEMADAWDKAGAHIAALRKGGAQVIPIMKNRA